MILVANAKATAVTTPLAATVMPVLQSSALINALVEMTAVTTNSQKVRRTRRISSHPRWETGVVSASMMVRVTMAMSTSKPSAIAIGRLRHDR